RHCDSSISKTINFPREATVDDVRQIFELAIDENVKGVTVYRDGCRDLQPMALKHSNQTPAAPVAEAPKPAAQAASQTAAADLPPRLRTKTTETGEEELNPIKLPEIMSCLRIR